MTILCDLRYYLVFGSKFWEQYSQNVENHILSFYVDVKFKTLDEPINKPLYFYLMKYFFNACVLAKPMMHL